MTRFNPHNLTRFRIGDVAYLRVRVTGGVIEPFTTPPQRSACVELVDRAGKALDKPWPRTHLVPESAIVSMADAFRAVREARG